MTEECEFKPNLSLTNRFNEENGALSMRLSKRDSGVSDSRSSQNLKMYLKNQQWLEQREEKIKK